MISCCVMNCVFYGWGYFEDSYVINIIINEDV